MKMDTLNTQDTQVLTFDEPSDDTAQFPRVVSGSSNINPEQPATIAYGDAIPPCKPKTSYAFNGGDLNSKPILKRPAFWIVFAVLVMLIVIPIAMNLFTTSPSEQALDAPVATSEPDNHKTDADSFDWDSLTGERLSNAYQILEHAGLKRGSNLNVNTVTDDGKYVIMPSNWIITSIEHEQGTESVLIHLKHAQDESNANTGTTNDDGNANDGNASNDNGSGSTGQELLDDAGQALRDPDMQNKIKDTVANGFNKLKESAGTVKDKILEYAQNQ